MEKILVIDDDKDITGLLDRFLTKKGFSVIAANSGKDGIEKAKEFLPQLIMCDYRLDDMNGAELLTTIKQHLPSIPIIIITGYSDLKVAVNVIKLGAHDYITKPLFPDEILLTIRQTIDKTNAASEPVIIGSSNPKKTDKSTKNSTDYLFNDSPESAALLRQIELVAPTDYSVIIYGESGSGKEGLAKKIHDLSSRAGKPFVTMDCGALSKELASSELFGHEKGSFTGALNQKIGQFELANGGTIFLDEIANLPYDVQVSLLRVVQERKMRRIGGNKEMNIDVRIIVASNERLSEAAKKGKFREDLYHRFNEFSVDIPPLRYRKNDILFFANHFLKGTAAELGKKTTGFSKEVINVFLNYPWYGNLRELKNVIKRSMLLTNGDMVETAALPFEMVNYSQLSFDDEPVQQPTKEANTPVSFSKDNNNIDIKQAALQAEYDTILAALQQVNFNKSKAAEMLGIDRKTLYNKIKQMKIG